MPNEQYKIFNCYQILGINHDVSPEIIRNAYRQESLKNHPDRGGSHEAQVRTNLAYEVLSNPIERQAHDIFWRLGALNGRRRPEPTSVQPVPPTGHAEKNHVQQESFAGLKKRVSDQAELKKGQIWRDLDNRIKSFRDKFKKDLVSERRGTAFMLVGAMALGVVGSAFPPLWIGSVALAFSFLRRVVGGVQIDRKPISLFSDGKLDAFARDAANRSCSEEVQGLDRYFAEIAALSELLSRSSSFDDSEEQIVRRLAGAFFLMGYMPVRFDRDNRLLLVTDSEENLLVRFRHRRGAATNVAYVRALRDFMSANAVSRGFIFCSPGLSGNAAAYASTHGIQDYSLEAMNDWIQDVMFSSYAGPSGDVFQRLEKFRSFLSSISLALPAYRRRSHYG